MLDSLLIRVYSFSFAETGPLPDVTGHGGGYVFDCRGLKNPGRLPDFADKHGRAPDCRLWLDQSPEVPVFLNHVLPLVRQMAEKYAGRGFTDMQVACGCTGGRHRSVYTTERVAEALREDGYPVRVIHWQMEQEEPEQFQRRRAMVFAAGKGTRLAPLTDTTPKALIKADGKTMLAWTIGSIQNAGFDEITVNTHHHFDQLNRTLDKIARQHPETLFHVSREPTLLGTGGGLKRAGRFLHGPSPVLVHNVDIWSEFNLNELHQSHMATDLATLAVQQRKSSRQLLVDDTGKVCGRSIHGDAERVAEPEGELTDYGYSGVMVINPALLEMNPALFGDSLIDTLLERISAGYNVRTKPMAGAWFDMGTEEKLARLERYLG